MATLRILLGSFGTHWKAMLLHGLIFAFLFQIFMMLALIVRFQALPNYVTFYDWIGNVSWIIQSTPSWSDITGIIWEEWLIEIGKMNYDYGTGISEWSLNVVPSRLIVLTLLGALMSWSFTLMRHKNCALQNQTSLRATSGFGMVLVAMTNATMSWVVCCATPSWVVGLAMLGLGVSTSLALETMGPLLSGLGFGTLLSLIVYLAWRQTKVAPTPKGKPAHA